LCGPSVRVDEKSEEFWLICCKGAQLADQRALGHLLQAQRGDDLVDVGLLVDDRLPVDLADRADQALRVPRGIVGAV
jgi:hypothetical protein